MDYVKAFVVGGIICVLAQILMDKTKLLPGRIMVILVCTGVVIGALGIYKPLLEFAQCGAVDKDGFIGLFRGGFQMAAVGSSAALIFGYIASLIFKPKMTK